jgi:xylulokinase
MARLAEKLPLLSRDAAALVLCAQMCGVVCADRSGAALRPCLIWLDKRAGREARRLVGGLLSYSGYGLTKLARWLPRANGVPSLNGADPPAKLHWIRDHEPHIWRASEKFLDVKDWLLLRATGRAVTTYDCANLTWMMDNRAGRLGWSEPLMELVGVERARLPDIVDGSSVVGPLRADAALDLGLPAGLPVVAGSGDVCAAALGSGAVADGALHIYAGTSSWIGGFFPSRRLNVAKRYASIASAAAGRPLLIATQETSGECLDWAVTAFGGGAPDGEAIGHFMKGAEDCAVSAHDPLFLPWLSGERMPIDDEHLRGGFLGLSMAHDRRHMARAVVEGIALNLCWAMEAVARESGVTDDEIPIVGMVANSRFFVQLLADVLQRPLRMLRNPECVGIMGAASFASTALRWTDSPWAAASRSAQVVDSVAPRLELAAHYARRLLLLKDAWRRTAPWFQKVLA